MTPIKIGRQGEVAIYKIDAVPSDAKTISAERNSRGDFIVSHSESGNHHVVTGGVQVLERTNDVSAGMRILYAILETPQALEQDAATPHKKIDLPPGVYEFRTAREFDPFAEEVRRVAD